MPKETLSLFFYTTPQAVCPAQMAIAIHITPHIMSFNTASGMPCANMENVKKLVEEALFQYRKRYALRKSCTLEALVSVG